MARTRAEAMKELSGKLGNNPWNPDGLLILQKNGADFEVVADIMLGVHLDKQKATASADKLTKAVCQQFGDRIPFLANMVEGDKTHQKTASELEALGFGLGVFRGGMVRVLAYTEQSYLASLSEHGSTLPFRGKMLDFDHLNELINTNDMLALGAGYDSRGFEETSD